MIRASCIRFLAAFVLFAWAAPNLPSQERAPQATYSSLIYWAPVSQLVTQEDILRDLKLTVEQQAAVRKALAEYQEAIAVNRGQNLAETMQKLQEAARQRDEAIRAALGDKTKRLDQIAAQSAGLAAFVTRIELQAQLAITDEQLAKGREILDAAYREMTGAGTGRTRGKADRRPENRTAFVDKTTPKLLELLTDEQKKRWQHAIGELVPAATLVKVRTTSTNSPGMRRGSGGVDSRNSASSSEAITYSQLVYWAPISQLLSQDEVVRGLNLTAEQQASIRMAEAEYRQFFSTNPSGFSQNSVQEAVRKRDEAIRASLGDKAQRLDQISAQAAGLAAFVTRAEVRQQLAITNEQLAKGRGVVEATYKEMQVDILSMTAGPRVAETRTAFVDKTTPKLLELLTDEQKKRWQQATGELVPAATLVKVRTTSTSFPGTFQAPGGFGPYSQLVYWAPISQLLSQDEVMRGLNLTADQQASIRKAQEEYQKVIAASPRTRENSAEVFQKQQEAARKRDEAIRAVLGDKAQRLNQIAAQSAGLAAFITRVELRQQLRITDEQLAKGREILEATYKEITAAGRRRPAWTGISGAESRTAFVDKTTPRLLELLTVEQKKLWQDAVGEAVPAATLVKVRTIPDFGSARTFPSPQVSTSRLYQEAQALEKNKDYAAAVKKMKEAIELAPNNDLYRAYASHVERLAGNYADGVEHALQAIKISEIKVAWYYASVAFNAHAKGDRELARIYCKKVIDFGADAVGQANFDFAKKLLDELEGKK